MIEKVKKYINEHNLIDKNKYVVVSDSAGVDSSVLLDILIKLNYKIVIAHINHNVRLESKDEMAYLKDYSSKLKIPFECIILDKIEKDFEESARNQRYIFFKQVAKKYNTNQIVTAHHLDDNLETILMKLTRGSNLYGYAGIKNKIIVDGYIISRPLLCVDKDMIYKYAKKNNIKYFEDYTNYETIHTRNRFRLNIVPLIKMENKNIYKSSIQYSNQLLNAFNYIRSQTMKLGKITINDFNNLDEALKYDYISLKLEENNIEQTYEKIEDIIDFLKNKSPNSYLNIGGNKIILKSYDSFKITELYKKSDDILFINGFGEYNYGNYVITFDKFIAKNSQKYIRLCYNNIVYPLMVRTRKSGDYIKMPYGKKKLKDLFIDKKLPMELRDTIPLLFNGDESLLGIPGIIQTKQDNFDCYVCFHRRYDNERNDEWYRKNSSNRTRNWRYL